MRFATSRLRLDQVQTVLQDAEAREYLPGFLGPDPSDSHQNSRTTSSSLFAFLRAYRPCALSSLYNASMKPLIKLAGPPTLASKSAVGFAARICSSVFPSRIACRTRS